jgi:hypothetical protein
VKAQAAERDNWNCDKCRTEMVRMLQQELQNALRQIDELTARNRELEDKLLLAGTAKTDAVSTKETVTKCRVVGDSIVPNVGTEYADMVVECFPGIKTEQLNRVIDKRDLGSPETVIIHVGTNDMGTKRNLDLVMGEVYDLVSTAKKKLPNSRLVLSGVLRRRDVSWRRTGARTDRLDWVANALGLTFVDPNSWIEDGDFARDGLHLNWRGKMRLCQLYAIVSGLDVGGSAGSKKGPIMENGSNSTWDTRATQRAGISMNAESDGPTAKLEREETEDAPKEESEAAAGGRTSEGKPLVLLQVNCRSICNKTLEYWNLIETYNPDVILGTESWLSDEINNAEVFRDNYITFRRDRCSRGGGVLC